MVTVFIETADSGAWRHDHQMERVEHQSFRMPMLMGGAETATVGQRHTQVEVTPPDVRGKPYR
jgi:predicted phage gp36 major capsid-like protein